MYFSVTHIDSNIPFQKLCSLRSYVENLKTANRAYMYGGIPLNGSVYVFVMLMMLLLMLLMLLLILLLMLLMPLLMFKLF